MSWKIDHGNALFFSVPGDVAMALALAENTDDGSRSLGLFHQVGGVWAAIPPFIYDGVTDAYVGSFGPSGSGGTVAQFLEAQMPLASQHLQAYLGNAIIKPDPASKTDCAAWDIAKAVTVDVGSGTFTLSPARPLPHALP